MEIRLVVSLVQNMLKKKQTDPEFPLDILHYVFCEKCNGNITFNAILAHNFLVPTFRCLVYH
jgi:hypothetical protein